jgi:hypothetical protein
VGRGDVVNVKTYLVHVRSGRGGVVNVKTYLVHVRSGRCDVVNGVVPGNC